MPCNSDYMEANNLEVELSKVACFLCELRGETIEASWMEGYHPSVYGVFVRKEDADDMVRELCNKLQNVDITKCSLELQIWWRDHQKADMERIKSELMNEEEGKDRELALSKLTDYEKTLLGLEDS